MLGTPICSTEKPRSQKRDLGHPPTLHERWVQMRSLGVSGARWQSLEEELAHQLYSPARLWIGVEVCCRRAGDRGHHAKVPRTVRIVAIRLPEVSVVKGVEGLH